MKKILCVCSIFSLVFCVVLQFYFSKIENDSRNSDKKSIETLREELNEKLKRSQEAMEQKRSVIKAQNDEKIRVFRVVEEKKLEEFRRVEKSRIDKIREQVERRIERSRLIGSGRANEVFRDLGLIVYNTQGVTQIGVCSVESVQPVENGDLLIKYHNVTSEKQIPKFKILFYDTYLKCCGKIEKKYGTTANRRKRWPDDRHFLCLW